MITSNSTNRKSYYLYRNLKTSIKLKQKENSKTPLKIK